MNRIGVLLVVFVLGAASGFLAARFSLGEAPDDRLAPGGETAEGVSGVERESVPPLGGSAPRRSIVAEAEPERVASAPMKEKPVDDIAGPTRGTGVVTGTVKTAEGLGIGDVVVRLEAKTYRPIAYRSPWGTAPPTVETPEEAASEAMRRVQSEAAARLETTTAADGTFHFDGLADGVRYFANAWKKGYRISAVGGGGPLGTMDGDRADFTAAETYDVLLRVVGSDGSEVEKAMLMIMRESSGFGAEWRRGDVLELLGGLSEIEARSGEFQRGEAKVVLPPPTHEPVVVEIRLVMPTVVRGKVSCTDPKQVDRIDIYALAGVVEGAITRGRTAAAVASTTAWNARSKYEITTLKPGTYTFCAMRGEKTLLVTTREILPGVTNLDLEIPAESTADYVIISAFDPAGQPTRVDLMDYTNGARANERGVGTYWLPRSNPERGYPERSAKSVLIAESEQFGCVALEYSPEKDTELSVRFEAATTLVVKLEGYKGTVAEGGVEVDLLPNIDTKLRLNWTPRSRSATDERLREIDPAGIWTLKALQPGRYDIEVRMTAGAMQGRRLVAKAVVLAVGSNACTLVLPELGRLVVATTAPTPGFYLILDNESPNEKDRLSVSPSERRTTEGRYLFESIPVGTYKLYGRDGKTIFKGRQVLVKGDSSVVYEAERE